MDEQLNEENEFGFARVYAIELLYSEKPAIDRELLYKKVEEYTGKIDQPQADEQAGKLAVWEPNEQSDTDLLHFFHLNYMVDYSDGAMPAQTSIMSFPNKELAQYETAVQQSWHWQEAEERLATCHYTLLLTDLMAAGLEPKKRNELHTNMLRALIETAPCQAIYFKESDKLVEPSQFLDAVAQGDLLHGAVNVRFYNVEGTGSERQEGLVDTVGLAALGIPDVQCHFYDLDVSEVAQTAGNIAYYLFDKGDIIEDGETVGFTEDMRWKCEHQYSLAEPRRIVLDLDPGEPYYAGRQEGKSEEQN